MNIFIENEAGSCIKHEHNEKTLELKGKALVSRAFPWPYGFILNTTGQDGDNVDCFVLTRKSMHTGDIVDCDPIGMIEQIEDGEIDHKIFARPYDEAAVLDDAAVEKFKDFALHVFDHIPGKTKTIGRRCDRDAAIEYIEGHRDRAQTTRR
ncbi:MAG TPA: inorganic diphosphatase [Candidatus Angelobacter sp.]|jgi:inorganic pyrophosphatase|nr:inorganic diphosphatase [Candidatus Angelobacter sp.]